MMPSRFQFVVGKGEFGDIYHLLATACLLTQESIAIKFEDFEKGEQFFRLLGIRYENLDKELDGKTRLRETANVISEHFCAECMDPIARAIASIAKEKRW